MWFEKLPLVGSFFLFYVAVTYIYGERTEIHPHDAQRIGQLALIGLSALLISTGYFRVSRTFILFNIALGLAALTAGRWALIECTHLVSLYMLAVLWSARLRDRSEPQLLVFSTILVGVYLALLLPRWAALVFENLNFHPQEFFTGFSNQRFFGHWVTLSLPLIVLARQRAEANRFRARLLDVIVGLWLCFVIASGTRGTWLALLAVALAAPLAGSAGRALAWGMTRSAFIGIILYGLMFWLAPLMASGDTGLDGLSRIAEGAALSGREVLWSLAVEGITARPLLGAGPMMFSALRNDFAAHPHNVVLQLAYEWGIPLTLLAGAFASRMLHRHFMKCRQYNDALRVALLMSIVGGLLQAQVDGVLVMPFGQVLFVLLCAWLASLDGGGVAQPVSAESNDGSRAYRLVLLLLVFAQIWLVSPELTRLEAWEEETLDAAGTGLYFPRFWAQGVIPATPQPFMPR
ncbi:MAG: O-antigen ligase family protein [Pseudomonadota bacterium]